MNNRHYKRGYRRLIAEAPTSCMMEASEVYLFRCTNRLASIAGYAAAVSAPYAGFASLLVAAHLICSYIRLAP